VWLRADEVACEAFGNHAKDTAAWVDCRRLSATDMGGVVRVRTPAGYVDLCSGDAILAPGHRGLQVNSTALWWCWASEDLPTWRRCRRGQLHKLVPWLLQCDCQGDVVWIMDEVNL
jgi:hypothetical protein